MRFYFTSFQNIPVVNENMYSIARWQDPGFHLPILSFFVSSISLARCGYNIDSYINRVQRLFLRRRQAINVWLSGLLPNAEIWLVCKCPNAKVSREQIDKLGFFVCHGVVVAKYLYGMGYDIECDNDRSNNQWDPKNHS